MRGRKFRDYFELGSIREAPRFNLEEAVRMDEQGEIRPILSQLEYTFDEAHALTRYFQRHNVKTAEERVIDYDEYDDRYKGIFFTFWKDKPPKTAPPENQK